ncbi:MAG: Transcriptional repressor NrdR [SAR116 cluster bacterium]|jgi:transcriptional repressor NrdR|nr:transcriptional regulator NrdR [Pseudomonadota bacterium]CAI8204920.1 MAG: Transcriptional repressor NrdR [SAR116 cluster bacterium]HCI20314.1 transcriptional regulator NrdR [Alphaproteobacteria bacterium]|tara:strand:+ start:656 stop:1108 length:453 start_codon:yes stop_codon:yes gene_type:complete
MLCPFCSSEDTQVKDSRPAEDGNAIRRRRLCGDCGARFTTFERVQLREINVVKRSGRRSVFDRDKLERSFQIALRKRDVNADEIARSINEIVRQLESHPEGDVPSAQVGELVMDALSQLDKVAYVRYASVYRNFREAKDFEAFVEKELGK